MKRLIVALALIAASAFVAGPAVADDVTPTDTSVTATDAPPTDPAPTDSTPAADPAPADPAPADPAPAVDPAPAPAPAPADNPGGDSSSDDSAVEPAVGTGAAGAAEVAAVTPQAAVDPDEKKVFVCKWVSTPGDGERLQTGQNPIDVSVSSVLNKLPAGSTVDDVKPGVSFADAQGRSVVLAFDTGQDDPPLWECKTLVAPVGPTVTQPTCNTDGSIVLPPDFTVGNVTVIHYSFVVGSADMTTGAYDVLAEIMDDNYTFAGGATTQHFTGSLVAPENCSTGIDAVADVALTQNCDGGDVPHPTAITGVKYDFIVGDGVSGPWTIKATPEKGYVLNGETEFSGDAGDPASCPTGPEGKPDESGTLPDTGGPQLGLIPLGGLLIVAGAMVVGRRRTA